MGTTNATGVRAVPLCALLMITQLLACGSGVIEVGTQLDVNGGQPSLNPFESARDVDISLEAASRFTGSLRHAAHVEIWNLGAFPSGVRLDVHVEGHGQNFSMALFDGVQQVRILNNDRNGGLDPGAYLNIVEPMTVYLAVSSDLSEPSAGPYTVTATPSSIPSRSDAHTQHVVLNFEGALGVRVGNSAPIDITPFNAADLQPEWGPLTGEMKDIVFDHMERIYTGLGVVFHGSGDPDLPPDEELTWIHFGGSHASNVGLADRIDYGNRNAREKAVVYTHNFAKYVRFGYSPEQLASGFANVAAHELGHLLGMNHTDDPRDVMNVSPTVDALVAPQYFVRTAGLDGRVFPLGLQDGARGIMHNVGGYWEVVEAARRNSAAAYAQALPAERAPAATGDDPLVLSTGSTCSHVARDGASDH